MFDDAAEWERVERIADALDAHDQLDETMFGEILGL